jgi:hypothetical protein
MREDVHTNGRKELATHPADSDTRSRLTGARAFEDVTEIMAIVLEATREVRVARARAGEGLRRLGERSGAHTALPARVILVLDPERDGSPERLTTTYAARELGSVRLDLHSPAAAISALAPGEVGVDVLREKGQARRNALEDRHERRSV